MKIFALLTLPLLLSGCASMVGDVRAFPEPQAMPAPAAPMAAAVPTYGANANNGSIYASGQQGGGRMALFQDNKARDIGDLLTIVLVERTTSKASATTAIGKDSGIEMASPTIAGVPVTYKGNPILEVGIEGSRKFNGNGSSAQSNQLDGSLSARVVEVLGNGHLRVYGEKRLRLNQGDELVQVQGIVRLADIGPDNRIASDRVADARIVYGGRGAMARSNAMGWLGRFFNSAAFPY
ncbi:MAG: flagellar basal body L-ring protein FlgH [Pseudomonadota bacterium]|nr:flagellar basal body L-ring protein FlgH [Pseudomonadota bacterium]